MTKKRFKSLFGMLLVMSVLVTSFATPAFAAETYSQLTPQNRTLEYA